MVNLSVVSGEHSYNAEPLLSLSLFLSVREGGGGGEGGGGERGSFN